MSIAQRPTATDQNHLQEEFLRLLLPMRDRLSHYARAVARTREEADDLVGDTILAALEGFAVLRSHDGFASYLFRIASRLYKRRRWRRRLFGELEGERASELLSNVSSPEISTDVVLLYRALDALPPAHREAVVLFEISGLSQEEIRVVQGVSLSAVKSRVSRGRKQLAILLGARDDVTPITLRSQASSALGSTATNGRTTTNGSAATNHTEPHLIYSGPQING